MDERMLTQRRQQVLYDKKWRKFLRRTWLFKYIPFVDFALAAGSMALGNVSSESDFDVIVGARTGRIFTARFFCVLAFGFFGWRRRKLRGASGDQLKNSSAHKLINSQTADKICLNHFVTPKSYRLSLPYNEYWKKLYQNLVPVYGSKESVKAFWDANAEWLGKPVNYQDDLRHKHRKPSWIKKLREFILAGAMGDWLEKFLKNLQVKKIEKSLKTDQPGFEPRIKYSDDELEFHPDTSRTLRY